MLGFDGRAARSVWTAALVVLLLVLVYLVRRTLFVFILAILFAYLLAPLVNLLDRALPARRTRAPALALAYMIVVAVLVVLIMQIGSRVVEQANNLIKVFPNLLADWQKPTPGATPAVNSFKAQLLASIREQISLGTANLLSALPKAGLKALSIIATNVIDIVIVPILSFFFLKDGRRIREQAIDLFAGGPRRDLFEDLLGDINLLLAHYIRALLILSAAAFTCYSIFFSIVGVPYAVLLAALAFWLEFIPMIGPFTAGAVIITVVALNKGPVLLVLIFLLVYRLFQDYILSPHVMGSGLELHPLLVLFGVFAGAEVAGIAGAFLSVPILALVRVFYHRVQKSRARNHLEPSPTSTI